MTILEGLDGLGLGQPTQMIYRGETGPVTETIADSTGAFEPKMSAPWLLFWFAGSKGWDSVDIPVLVVLQHKPSKVEISSRGLTIRFPGPAGR